MAREKKVIPALKPLAWLYGLAQVTRNALYDSGIIKQGRSALKTIVVGNISAGGTGKTPHAAWLAGMLSENYEVAVLSRGYKRKSRGFRWVNVEDHPDMTGDEPLELKRAFPGIPVAVDGNRLRGLERMALELDPPPDYVILDDGFQHRRLKPDYSFVLTRYENPFWDDYLLPAGRLREPISAIRNADALIITGAPESPLPEICSRINNLIDEKDIFFSSYNKGKLVAVTEKARRTDPESIDSILCISGIAGRMTLDENNEKKVAARIDYPDHHRYNKKDIDLITREFRDIPGKRNIIVTTGKDAVKLTYYPDIKDLPVFRFTREILMEPDQARTLITRITQDGKKI